MVNAMENDVVLERELCKAYHVDYDNDVIPPSPPDAGIEGDDAERVDEETQSHGLPPAQRRSIAHSVTSRPAHQETFLVNSLAHRDHIGTFWK